MTRLQSPGPSFLKELPLSPADPRRVGIGRPTVLADEWWVALLWCEEDASLITFREAGPAAGPPPGSPLLRLGPVMAGELAGLVLEEDGRRQLRLRLGQPPEDESTPWDAPLAVLAGFRFEPARQAAMTENQLASAVLEAFRAAVVSLSGAAHG